MIKENNVVDQTQLIRNLKHSSVLRQNINDLIVLKSKYDDPQQLNIEAVNECNFLFTYYTDIYNKIRKDEINISILIKFLDVLKNIEDGELDQHEGSFMIGTLLKELYVDSALKKADKLNANDKEREQPKKPEKKISYKQFKKMI